ncbi:BldC family transcriptional regulator [Actinomadura miaoliensis]|uniref:Helix-turn-helix domain-containing protein n=1 Tax=Actinomadura miaoliensis TaxID=430685 RepID=A0ABP7WAX1_9ACTN
MNHELADKALLTAAEVAELFRVDPKTVGRWASEGRLGSIRTLGGHRRYRSAEVFALLNGDPPSQNETRQDEARQDETEEA